MRILLGIVLAVILHSSNAFAFTSGFFVKNASITKQLSGAYRLRVEVDWDRTTYPNIAEPFLTDYTPALGRFEFNEPVGSFNFFNTYGTNNALDNDHRNDWGGWSAINTGTLGTFFGLDFFSPDDDLKSMTFNYLAQINFWSTGQLPTGEFVGFGGPSDPVNQTGQFTAELVPEPSTFAFILLGLGLWSGATVLRIRSNR